MTRSQPTRVQATGRSATAAAVLSVVALLAACSGPAPHDPAGPAVEWAIAIHGGAGVMSREQYADREQDYLDVLDSALAVGREILENDGESLDAVVAVVTFLEDEALFNAGRGAVLNRDGVCEMDASVMRGSDLACGGVTGVTTVKNPIALARLVMERTSHVLLAGAGAERFADDMAVERMPPEYFKTDRRVEQWKRRTAGAQDADRGAGPQGTVGAVALDRHGNLAAATSTGGLTAKMYGRVGDTPVAGAGNYASNATCAVSGTGTGEEFIRHGAAARVAALMEYRGHDVTEAVAIVVHEILEPGEGGVIAVGRGGRIAMAYNTVGMFRGATDSSGYSEVKIGE